MNWVLVPNSRREFGLTFIQVLFLIIIHLCKISCVSPSSLSIFVDVVWKLVCCRRWTSWTLPIQAPVCFPPNGMFKMKRKPEGRRHGEQKWISINRYNFDSDPRNVGAIVILAANESSYTGEHWPFMTQTFPTSDLWIEQRYWCAA